MLSFLPFFINVDIEALAIQNLRKASIRRVVSVC